IYKGLGIGAEVGPLFPWSVEHSGYGYGFGRFDYVKGLGSVNLSYHLLPATANGRRELFVTAGSSILFRAGYVIGLNVGGGMNLWVKPKAALRLEIRDYQSFSDDTVSFRIGMTFR